MYNGGGSQFARNFVKNIQLQHCNVNEQYTAEGKILNDRFTTEQTYFSWTRHMIYLKQNFEQPKQKLLVLQNPHAIH
jgi:hypothetical protein